MRHLRLCEQQLQRRAKVDRQAAEEQGAHQQEPNRTQLPAAGSDAPTWPIQQPLVSLAAACHPFKCRCASSSRPSLLLGTAQESLGEAARTDCSPEACAGLGGPSITVCTRLGPKNAVEGMRRGWPCVSPCCGRAQHAASLGQVGKAEVARACTLFFQHLLEVLLLAAPPSRLLINIAPLALNPGTLGRGPVHPPHCAPGPTQVPDQPPEAPCAVSQRPHCYKPIGRPPPAPPSSGPTACSSPPRSRRGIQRPGLQPQQRFCQWATYPSCTCPVVGSGQRPPPRFLTCLTTSPPL